MEEQDVVSLRRAVVKVLTVADPPDYDQPWQTLGATSSTGSGAIVATKAGPRVLTNAHVVEDHTFVEIRRYGHARKTVAHVEGLSQECDLALLRVDDEAILSGVPPIRTGALPALGDQVWVLGFPIGGDRLSITEGIVSRIEMTTYTQSERDLLSVQIDAAINAGNSGGPVIRDGALAGIAFQALEEAENIGYVIPVPVVEHFLRDMEDGALEGIPDLGVWYQPLESAAHRRQLGLPGSRRGGVLLTHVQYGGSAWQVLEPGDVLLQAGGKSIASDGTVAFRKGARIEVAHVAAQRDVGDTMPVKVWRDGRLMTLTVTLQPHRPLVPWRSSTGRPSYFVYAGLLFVPLTGAYLETWDDDWRSSAPAPLVALHDLGIPTRRTREVVVLQKVLADRTNRGYHDLESQRISKVQGRSVRSLEHLVRVVERTEGEFVTFDTSEGQRIVIDRAEAAEREAAIARRYGVPADRSPDLRRESG